ncbi:MAG: NAD(+) synthase [Thermoplasmata archaeon]
MIPLPLVPRFEPEMAEAICRFIGHRVEQAGASGVVFGLSGGLDSTVVGALSARALGEERVLALLMPEKRPAPEALLAVKWLGVPHRIVPIGELTASVLEVGGAGARASSAAGGGGRRAGGGGQGHASRMGRVAGKGKGGMVADPRLVAGNVKARLRMILLYLEANRSGRLVAGTGNKSEILTGYFTKYGDGGVDILPIGDLYKTQVRALAEWLGVPERIRLLVPSAGLYPGQTDEGELGISYEELDRILLGLELGLGPAEISRRAGITQERIARVMALVRRSAHKRLFPQIPKLAIRTVGLDWREELLHAGDRE